MQIDEEQIDLGQVFGARRQVVERRAVQAPDGRAERVAGVGDADHVLSFAAVAVLGAEDDGDADAERVQDVARVHHSPVQRRGMRQEAHARPAQLGPEHRVGGEPVQASAHPGVRIGKRRHR